MLTKREMRPDISDLERFSFMITIWLWFQWKSMEQDGSLRWHQHDRNTDKRLDRLTLNGVYLSGGLQFKSVGHRNTNRAYRMEVLLNKSVVQCISVW